MPTHSSRVAVACALCALAGLFLLVADLDERLRFSRAGLELALLAPAFLWLIYRRLRLRH